MTVQIFNICIQKQEENSINLSHNLKKQMKNKLKRNNIKVFVRSRPLLQFQNEPAWQISESTKIQCMYTKSVKNKIDKTNRRSQADLQQKMKDLNFRFEKIFQDNITSEKIYKQQAKSMVNQSLNNSTNLTLMCYGQTCSGKTFTILGQQKYPGLMPCLLRDLTIYKKQNLNSCQIKMSYFQIYNQNVYDLLGPGGKKANQQKLKISEDKQYGWEVIGLKKEVVESFEDCIKIIEKGQKNRAYACKQNHDRSSRSHTIMRIYIDKQDKKYNQINQIFNIVDLAGSQRLSQFSKNPQQTASINKSLFQLSNVISKLSSNQKSNHIPYRDSKLTKLLQCSLNGKSNCIIMFCISPAVQSFQQSLSTLRLAKKAKHIQTQVDIFQQSLMKNWSPLQKQLFQTKQKLARKTIQCEQLNQRLDFLSRQLQKLQYLFDQMENKREIKLDLAILLDHQNFVLKNLENQQILLDKSEEIAKQVNNFRAQFLQQIQQLYEQYATNICSVYIQNLNNKKSKVRFNNQMEDKFIINIEKICFMDLVHNRYQNDSASDLLNQLKMQTIDSILKDLKNSQSNKQNKMINSLKGNQLSKAQYEVIKNLQFKELLLLYKDRIKQKISCLDQTFSNSAKRQINNKQQTKFSIQTQRSKKLYSSRQSADKSNVKCYNLNNQTKTIPKSIEVQSAISNSGVQYIDSSIVVPSSLLAVNTNQIQNNILNLRQKQKNIQGKNLYSWGCTKDGRVFKGKDAISGISLLNTMQNYGIITKIKTGYNHNLMLNKQGTLFSWGKNNFNQITAKNTPSYTVPRQIRINERIKSIATGWGHSLALSQHGNVYSWGYGQNGQLGHNDLQSQSKPKIIQIDLKFSQVFAGHSHSGILDQQRNLYTFGFNKDYRCLIKQDCASIIRPTKVLVNRIKSVSLGLSHSAVITAQNFVFCGGVGTNGQLGRQLTNNMPGCQLIAVQNKKFQQQQNSLQKVYPLTQFIFQSQFDKNEFIIDIKCGQNSTYFLTNIGNLYLCGKGFNKNSSEKIFTPKLLLTQIYNFSIGSRHGFAFNINGNKIYGWGFNMYNQLGNNQQKDLMRPQVISTLSSLNISAIQCGFIHSLALCQ